MNYSSKKLGGYLLAFFVVFGIATIGTSTAQAQYPYPDYGRDRDYRRDRDDRYRRDDDDRYRRGVGRNGYYNAYQIARDEGFRDGLATGAADAQRGQSYNPQRSHYWRNGGDGYDSRYGNRGQYKQVFRDAFVQGYSQGYQRYGGYNRGRNNGRWGTGRLPFPW